MIFQRLDHAPTPDVDVMLSVLCEARIPGQPCSQVASIAAARVLNQYGVPAKVETVRLVALNRAAVERLPLDGALDLRAPAGPGLPQPGQPWIGDSGPWPHTVVNVNGTLLALAIDEYRREQAGFDPQPGFFEVPTDFWDGTDAIFLAGDDGSGMFMWATPDIDCPPVAEDAVEQEMGRLTATIGAAGHPGWRSLIEA